MLEEASGNSRTRRSRAIRSCRSSRRGVRPLQARELRGFDPGNVFPGHADPETPSHPMPEVIHGGGQWAKPTKSDKTRPGTPTDAPSPILTSPRTDSSPDPLAHRNRTRFRAERVRPRLRDPLRPRQAHCPPARHCPVRICGGAAAHRIRACLGSTPSLLGRHG